MESCCFRTAAAVAAAVAAAATVVVQMIQGGKTWTRVINNKHPLRKCYSLAKS